ncbi:GNAT family N-acetyltransferase [Clostridium sp. Marseille-P2415]|uniref:GNAT family N-acetyltransferase n=2 Tax=Clostridium sp. Marseille-P2415 TaxID=1805471 RepID=UPI00098839CA
MKIDRHIGILSILLQQEKVTAPYLAEKFEVSRRTINRDVEDLCKAGIPIVTVQGKHGGISIIEGYKMDKTLLTSSEMQAILSGLRSLDSVSGSNRYQLLMDKLSVGCPDILPSNQHVLINLSSWYKASLAPKIELIQNAIDVKKRIEFHYYSPTGESVRNIEPYLLIFQWSSWYVWGYCLLRNDFRLFKLNRMEELKCTSEDREERTVPEFSMSPYRIFQANGARVTALFDGKMKWRLIEEFGINGFEELEDGTLQMEIRWSDKESLFSWLLSFGAHVKIIEPVEYQNDFLQLLQNIRKRYRRRNSIYEDWRSYENQEFLLRPVRVEDAEELLKVYSDKEAQKRFNIDNFSQPCFFDTMEQMRNELEYYQKAYQKREFVRWSIVDKKTGRIIGTVENFRREAIDKSTGEPRDAFHNVALLRMDIRSDYEKEPVFLSLIHLILESAYDDFECTCIATKAPQIAEERRKALVEAGFKASDTILVGHSGQNYGDYFIRKRFEC